MSKSYRFLTGEDNADFCQRVSDALAEGYVLYGQPVMIAEGAKRMVGQAVVKPHIMREIARAAAEDRDSGDGDNA